MNGFEILGIEVTLAYYNDGDAEDEWKLASGEKEFAKEDFELRKKDVRVSSSSLV